MNVLLNPIGSHGDVHPFVGLGIELLRRGHDVTVITNAHFGPLVRAAGLAFRELGSDAEYRELAGDPNLWHPARGTRTVFTRGVLPMLRRTVNTIREMIVPGETVVVAGSLGLGARVVQEVTGVPMATVHLSPLCFRSMIDPPIISGAPMPKSPFLRRVVFRFADAFIIDPIMVRPLNAERARFGLPPVKRVLHEWWNSPTRVIGMFPDWFCPKQIDWPPQTVLTGFPRFDEGGLTPMTDDLERFLRSGGAPVAFTPGSAMLHGREFFETAAAACARMNRRGILLTRHREQVPRALPANVVHVDYAPFSELLPRCAAIVHHGGIGTTAQALAAGIPQLIMPMAHDQPDNATRLTRLGVGSAVFPKQFTARRVSAALESLLSNPDVTGRARAIASKMTINDAIATTADLVQDLLPNV